MTVCDNFIPTKLALDWSPQQIAGWLEQQFPDDSTMWVSHETISRSLFMQACGVLNVKSRTIIRLTMKQLRVLGMPLFHRMDGWLCIEGGLRQVMVVQADVAAQCLFEIQA